MASRSNDQLCKYFASSSGEGCKYGAMCKFSHDLTSGQVDGVVHTQQPKEEGSKKDTSTGEQHPRRRQCRYFKKGFCRDGNKCRYSHAEDMAAPQNKPQPRQATHQRKSRHVCKYFMSASTSGCRLGDSCRFVHQEPVEKADPQDNQSEDITESTEIVETASDEDDTTKQGAAAYQKRKGKSSYPCRYFNCPSGCRLGENCRYLHQAPAAKEELDTADTNAVDTADTNAVAHQQKKTPKKPKKRMGFLESDITEMTQSDQEELRDTELSIVKKRYPKTKEVPRERSGTAQQINFIPSDPDWPYDLKSVDINIYFPPLYPKKMMEVTVPGQENLPDTVRRCISFAIIDWVTARFKSFEKKGRVERVFRPFVRWLDGDLEDIFTDALTHYKKELEAKAAGIEIIPARHLQARYQQQEEDDEEESEEDETESEEDEYYEDTPYEYDEWNTPMSDNDETSDAKFDAAPKGTEIKLKDLQLGEFVATLSAVSIKLMVSCMRCKETGEMSTPPERLNQLTCSKCNHSQLIKYRPALIHGLTPVLGHLELEECTPADLLLMNCDFVANCLRCNKDNKLGGIPPGQPKNTWCKSCHVKLVITLEGAQFRKLQPAVIEKADSAYKVAGSKLPRNVRDPAIKLGKPLPGNGCCKHFKKSYRWLRFPCCGKTYPCDICHDEREDHEMKFANRMVCGFCSNEQAYSGVKPCSVCDSSMTSRSTEHWEGGRGCRDVLRMSKSDDKKYANCNKTVSRKAQTKAQPVKKTVKLRHT